METEGIVLNELSNSNGALQPSIRVEQALTDIKDTFQTSMLAKIPFTEIAMLGGSFSVIVETLAAPAAKGIYRCVFPKGVKGTLAMARDGRGALGTIMNESGIVAQARWLPVDTAIGPACLKAALVAVAVLAVAKQINDIKMAFLLSMRLTDLSSMICLIVIAVSSCKSIEIENVFAECLFHNVREKEKASNTIAMRMFD